MPHVLLIDDDTQERSALRVALELLKYHVTESGDGDSAIKAYMRERPDVAICALAIGQKDALATIRKLRSLDPTAQIIGITDSERDKSKFMYWPTIRFGEVTIAAKPHTPAALSALISRIVALAAEQPPTAGPPPTEIG